MMQPAPMDDTGTYCSLSCRGSRIYAGEWTWDGWHSASFCPDCGRRLDFDAEGNPTVGTNADELQAEHSVLTEQGTASASSAELMGEYNVLMQDAGLTEMEAKQCIVNEALHKVLARAKAERDHYKRAMEHLAGLIHLKQLEAHGSKSAWPIHALVAQALAATEEHPE